MVVMATTVANGQVDPQEKISDLTRAFDTFSQETRKLELAYNSLKERFQQVNRRLEETNSALIEKVSELDQMTHYLHRILGNMRQGLIFINLKGEITTYNEAAEKILDRNRTELLGRKFSTVFPDSLFGFSMIEAIKKRDEIENGFVQMPTVNSEIKELEIEGTFVLNGPAEHQGLILLLRDITEVRRLHRLANRNSRMNELGEMAASVAHEIRNPLGGIKGFASLLKRDLVGSPQQSNMADYIVEGAKRLDGLVNKILHYARPIMMEIRSVDLVPLAEESCKLVEADSNLIKGISIERHFPSSCILPIDTGMVKGALLNLLVNACQAMPNGGKLTVNIEQENGQVTLQVCDQGMGISEENLDKIFSPFFTTKPEGNGFGLAEVFRAVQDHGGNIEVQSKLGEGTTFTLHLPQTVVDGEGSTQRKEKRCR
jgi:PAS domain S-box-containing protein